MLTNPIAPENSRITPIGDGLAFERMLMRQNLLFAIGAGLIAGSAGAAAWATVTVITSYQVGYMAVAVGALTGVAVRYAGRGVVPLYGIIAASFALLGCMAGNVLSSVGFTAVDEGVPYMDILSLLTPQITFSVLKETFSPIDLIFYALAVSVGYRLGFTPISREDLS